MSAKLEHSTVARGLEKVSFHSNPKKSILGFPKNFQSVTQLHSSHTLSKYCSKFSKSGFNHTWTVNLQMFKLDLEKAGEQEIKLPISVGSLKKQASSRKKISFCFIDYTKASDGEDQNKLENSLRDGNTRSCYLPHDKSVFRSWSNS